MITIYAKYLIFKYLELQKIKIQVNVERHQVECRCDKVDICTGISNCKLHKRPKFYYTQNQAIK